MTTNSAYKFTCLPFGLKSLQASFCSVIARTLNPLNSKHVIYYLDDILLSTNDIDSHFDILDRVFWKLQESGLTVTPDKCKFFQWQVKYLGQLFDENRCRSDPARLKAVAEVNPPHNVSQLRRILGIFRWQQRYIKDYAKICMPFYELLKKDAEFKWTEECQKALDTLKARLMNNMMLAYL